MMNSKLRQQKKEIKRKVLLGMTGIALAGLAASAYFGQDDSPAGRLLAGAIQETNREVDCPESTGFVALYLFIILYMFFALAIICDDYFEPVLSTISGKLGLSEDVAGATFMAAGSSAPELLTSMSDALISRNSIGIGTIVGSAMFNILIIVALSATVTKGNIKLDWRPLARDSIFYIVSIVLLYIFLINDPLKVVKYGSDAYEAYDEEKYQKSLEDVSLNVTALPENEFGQISLVEGLIMVLLYCGYIVFMVFNQRIFNMCAPSEEEEEEEVFFVPAEKRHSIKRAIESFDEDMEGGNGLIPAGKISGIEDSKNVSIAAQHTKSTLLDEEYANPFAVPDNFLGRVWYGITFPINVLYYVTIPNTENPKYENWYALSFIMNIVWIGAACFGMVHYATRVGCLLDIDPIILGIVLLAGGTSVPDAIASMIVARQGFADMAIANALGSNVFDILLGLGLPWFIANIVFGHPSYIDNDGIVVSVAILLGTVLLFLATISMNKCQMNGRLGIAFVVFYVIYVTFSLNDEECFVPALGPRCNATEIDA